MQYKTSTYISKYTGEVWLFVDIWPTSDHSHCHSQTPNNMAVCTHN